MAYLPVPQRSVEVTVITGFTMIVPDSITLYVINSAVLLLAGTLNLPANPVDGQPLTINSPKGIVALILNGNGKSISGPTISAAGASLPIRLKYAGTSNTWYPN